MTTRLLSADLNTFNIDNRIIRMEITASQLVGFGNFDDILDTFHLTQMFGQRRLRFTDNADDRTIRSSGYMRLHACLFDMLDNFSQYVLP